MRSYFNKKSVYLTFSMVVVSMLVGSLYLYWESAQYINSARATASDDPLVNDNIWGWAWNDNIGWISMNSANCDVNFNGFIDTGACGGNDNNSTPLMPYGVNIEKNGSISANSNAWNTVVGYISFNAAGPYPGNPQTSVAYDVVTGDFSGWARICQLASDPATCSGNNPEGWISFSGTSPDYKTSIDKSNNHFMGHAWNTDYGYISFNSLNCDPDNNGFSNGGGLGCPAAGTAMARYLVGMTTNVHGWAWSSNYGWISMNCANSGLFECGAGFYGVNVNAETASPYSMGGYGWSPNLGWINFAPTAGYPGAPANGARIDLATGKITGWAKAEALGDDGWIKMSDDTVPSWLNHGTRISTTTNWGDFYGFAWNRTFGAAPGNGVGWISFNCASSSPTGGNICSIPPPNGSNFKTWTDFNSPPTISNFIFDSFLDPCAQPVHLLGARMTWIYQDDVDGNDQAGYEIQFKVTGDAWGTGWSFIDNNGTNQQYIYTFGPPNIAYDTNYTSRVKVKDSFGVWSNWSNEVQFTTYEHQYPYPYFTWFPAEPSAMEQVRFTDTSQYFGAGNALIDPCDDGICTRLWASTTDNILSITPNNASSSIIIFADRNISGVRLEATDNDGYMCATTSSITAKKRLPSWIESR